MKILWYNWKDVRNPEAGGAEVYTHEVARRLVSFGHKVTLFTSSFSGCKREELVDGVNIIRAGGKYTVYFQAREYYNRRFAKKSYDVVVDEINTIPFFTPRFVKKGQKIVVLIHQMARAFWFYETPFPINHVGYRFLEERWLRNYKDVPTITVSKSTSTDLEKLGFTNLNIVYNGLNVKPIKEPMPKAAVPAIVFVGRMKRVKKPNDLVEAFRIVKEEIADAELWMIGDGYLRHKLESMAISGVKFFGYLNNETRDKLVSAAWVIAVPGVREGWGQVVTDANAMGTPAVGYDIPGLRDSIRDGYNGIIVENNPKALAIGLKTLLLKDALRERLSHNALKWVKKFNWEKTTEDFINVLRKIVK